MRATATESPFAALLHPATLLAGERRKELEKKGRRRGGIKLRNYAERLSISRIPLCIVLLRSAVGKGEKRRGGFGGGRTS